MILIEALFLFGVAAFLGTLLLSYQVEHSLILSAHVSDPLEKS
uniref:Uncharacterized protein n=1 Tax=Rhizobium rhizogenes TaxID=359 RepID=A0A7S4ZRT8_RHIRH|nr:hypothetical protein pC5.8a_165 [Rhizobium rhizogenes]